jgi:hypothetical protein
MTMTKKEFLARFPIDDKQRVRFSIPMSFAGLAENTRGMEHTNEIVDDFVDEGYMLMDLVYTPLRVLQGDVLVVRVDADASMFVSEEDDYEG